MYRVCRLSCWIKGYYDFLHAHTRDIDGLSVVVEECLISLKARAWLDLTHRKAEGGTVDSKDIRKHRNDVLRLYQILNPDLRIELPETIRNDLSEFLTAIEEELSQDILKSLGIKSITPADVLATIRTIYGISREA